MKEIGVVAHLSLEFKPSHIAKDVLTFSLNVNLDLNYRTHFLIKILKLSCGVITMDFVLLKRTVHLSSLICTNKNSVNLLSFCSKLFLKHVMLLGKTSLAPTLFRINVKYKTCRY